MIELGERVDQAHHAGRDQVVQLDVLWKPLVDPPRQVAHRGKLFQQNLVALQLHRLGAESPPFLETINGLLDCPAFEQIAQVLVQQLKIQRLGRLVVPVVDPIGRMLDQRPEVVVQVQHQEAQALLL